MVMVKSDMSATGFVPEIVYDPNDGVVRDNNPKYDFFYDEDLLTYESLAFARDGYTFSGVWNTQQDGSGVEVKDGGPISESAEIKKIIEENDGILVLYAQYLEERWLTLDLNGGTLGGKTGTIKERAKLGDKYKLPEPSRDGYEFEYWEGSRYYAGETFDVTENHDFKAIWNKTATPEDKQKDSTPSYVLPLTGVE